MSKPGLGTGYDPLEGILTPPSSPTPVKSDRPVKVVDRDDAHLKVLRPAH